MEPENATILIFKTDIHDSEAREKAGALLQVVPGMDRWTIDSDDEDCVLRVVGAGLNADSVIEALWDSGFYCTELGE